MNGKLWKLIPQNISKMHLMNVKRENRKSLHGFHGSLKAFARDIAVSKDHWVIFPEFQIVQQQITRLFHVEITNF